jgi:hypothetical protein
LSETDTKEFRKWDPPEVRLDRVWSDEVEAILARGTCCSDEAQDFVVVDMKLGRCHAAETGRSKEIVEDRSTELSRRR